MIRLNQCKRYWDISGWKGEGSGASTKHIENYSSFMGGVDKHEWWISKYSVSIRSKKWYWPLFTRLIDMSPVNAYIIYTMVQNGRSSLTCSDLLSFRRDICKFYLRLGSIRLGPGKITFGSQRNPVDVRYLPHGHFIVKRTDHRRCPAIDCSSRRGTYCSKCNITLCIGYLASYNQK